MKTYDLKKEWPLILVTLAPIIYLMSIWSQLPLKVPMHWNAQGEIDRYGSRKELLILSIALPIFMYVLMFIIPLIDPKKKINERTKVIVLVSPNNPTGARQSGSFSRPTGQRQSGSFERRPNQGGGGYRGSHGGWLVLPVPQHAGGGTGVPAGRADHCRNRIPSRGGSHHRALQGLVARPVFHYRRRRNTVPGAH